MKHLRHHELGDAMRDVMKPIDGMNVLFVAEDEEEALHLRGLLDDIEDGSFYRLQWAPGFEEGLTRLREGHFPLCLVNYTLGHATGFHFMKQAKRLAMDTPMVLLSDMPFPRLAEEAFKAGASDFLLKPDLDANTLARTLRCAHEHENLRRELVQSRERYELVLRATNEGLWEWNLETNEMVFSKRWLELLGLKDQEIQPIPDEWFGRVYPQDLPTLKKALTQHLLGKVDIFTCEHRMIHASNKVLWMQSRAVAVRNQQGKALRIVGGLTNIHHRKRAEEQLVHDSTTDSLTGLLNRRRFMERLNQEFQLAKRHGRRLSVCIGDLDHFKAINDQYGHLAGDQSLALFGALLRKRMRVENVAGRYGGDEFCLLFPHANAQEAATALERIRQRIERATLGEEDGRPFHLTSSFGVAQYHPDFKESKDLLEAADRALYWAKTWGRNRVVYRDGNGNFFNFDQDNPNQTMSMIPLVSAEPPLHVLLACSDKEIPLWKDSFAESGDLVKPVYVSRESGVMDFLLRNGPYAKQPEDSAPDLIWLEMSSQDKLGLSVLRELKNHPRFRRIPVILVGRSLLKKEVLQGYELGAASVLRKPDSFEKQTQMLKRIIHFFRETVSLPPAVNLGS